MSAIAAMFYREGKIRVTNLTFIFWDLFYPLGYLLVFGVGINVNGRWTAFPSVTSIINADELALLNQGPQGVMAILGVGAGLFPPKVASILPTDVGSPERFISDSDLLVAAQFAAQPFADLGRGPGTILVVPVNPSTQATSQVSSATPTLLYTLTAKPYGFAGHRIFRKTETGKLTVTLKTAAGATIAQEVYTFTDGAGGAIAGLVAEVNARSGLVSATFSAEGTPVNAADTALAGATEPAAVTADWSDALNALNRLRVNCITVTDATSTIWALLQAYCDLKRCRGFIGSGLHDWNGIANRQASIATLISEAAALNSPRMMHVGLGMNGHPGNLAAAKYAALAASLDPSNPMTFKHLTGISALETQLDPDTEVGAVGGLLLGGVAPPVPDPSNLNTFLVSRGLSTWTGDDNLYRREHSVLAAIDGLQDNIEARLRDMLGREGTVQNIARVRNLVRDVCEQAKLPTETVRINGYDRDSIVASFTSDTVLRVAVDVEPIPPINFGIATLRLLRTDIKLDFTVDLNG